MVASSSAVSSALSKCRGEAIRAFLILQGIDLQRLVVRAFGDSKPPVKGTSPAARAKNRRVEFKPPVKGTSPAARVKNRRVEFKLINGR